MIRIEFWNGHVDKHGQHITTKHNPCLWANVGIDDHPWQAQYKNCLDILQKWFDRELTDEGLLHHLRYVAYGIGKRDFDNVDVVWWGKMTTTHQPKVVVQQETIQYTIAFHHSGDGWSSTLSHKPESFYWPLG